MTGFSVSCEDGNCCASVDRKPGGWKVGVSSPYSDETVFLTDQEMNEFARHLGLALRQAFLEAKDA